MNVMDRIAGRTPFDLSDLMVRVATRIATITTRRQPVIDRKERKARRYHEWHNNELRRPDATVSTTPPPEVNEAIAADDRELVKIGHEQYAATRADERAEAEALVNACDAAYSAAVAAFDALRTYQRAMRQYAAACGVPPLARLDDAALTDVALATWRQHVASVLHPPVPQPRQRAADNRLELD